jgi:MerR family transcriptional regulator, redox-sensitive transcriptional activator SoxR
MTLMAQVPPASAQVPSAAREITVGQLAARSGATVSALHFYEALGLVSARRTPGNQRRYPRVMLRRVAFIRASQRVGIPLAEIKAALDTLPARRTPTARDWARLSAAWCRDLDERISALQDLRNRLTGCIGCGCLSLTNCQLANPGDTLGASGTGPRRLSGQDQSGQDQSGQDQSGQDQSGQDQSGQDQSGQSGQAGHGQGGGEQDDGP